MRASPPARPRPGRCRHRAARGRRNPRTGEAVSIPARTVPAFKAGKTLCGRLDGQHGEPAVRWHPFGPRTAARAATLFRNPPAATRGRQFAAAFANSPVPSPQPAPRSLRACDYLAAAVVWMSIASGASGFHDLCGRERMSGIGRSATGAKACANQPPTSDPSRAGTLIWRAAGLLRRQRCGAVRAADAPPATRPLTPPIAHEPWHRVYHPPQSLRSCVPNSTAVLDFRSP